MGLRDTRNGSNLTYLSIFGGKIVQQWKKKPEPDTLPLGKKLHERINANDDTVYYIEYDAVEGLLTKAVLDTEGKYGDKINLTLTDMGEDYLLSFPIESSYANTFFNKLDNLDINESISFQPYSFEDDSGKKRSGFALYQDSEKIPNVYTREDPKDLPELKVTTKRGKTTYDSTERDNFFYEKFMKLIKQVHGAEVKETKLDTSTSSNDATEDDLPF